MVMRPPEYDILFEPVRIGPKTLKNRFYQVPHAAGFGVDKPWSQAAFRRVRAEGGWAAVCTENCSFSVDFDESPIISARLWDDSDLTKLAMVATEAHVHGALAGIELGHAGVHSRNHESRMPPPGPSQLPGDVMWQVVPRVMSQHDIAHVQREWASAAGRAIEGGFDIVYVYGGASYLPMQFVSPYFNRRTDRYGGSFDNRARFWLETLAAVRTEVDGRAAVACRIGIETMSGAGVHLDEALRFISLADDLVDLWDVNLGGYSEWDYDSGASRFFKEGWQLEWSGRIREVTATPIVGVGRLTDPDRMAAIIRSGAWDLIGAARPAIADPFLPKKIEEGRIADIRECIGCNVCVAKAEVGNHIGCTQNPTAGEEYRRAWHPEWVPPTEAPDRGVLVVGAGPAGLECAITLAERGFRDVHLVERSPHIGGSLSWIVRLPGLAEWGRLLSARSARIASLQNLAVITGKDLSARDVLDYGADLIVIATGSAWSPEGLNGFTRGPITGIVEARAGSVLTPETIMVDGLRPLSEGVVVYDCEGYFTASAIAELLAVEGHSVELVTPLERIGALSDETLEGSHVRRRLSDLGVAMTPATMIDRVAADSIACRTLDGRAAERELTTLVLCTQRLSDTSLGDAVRSGMTEDGGTPLFEIGDCVAPRLIADAIFDGHRLAREIDGDDPSRPLPYLRERGS